MSAPARSSSSGARSTIVSDTSPYNIFSPTRLSPVPSSFNTVGAFDDQSPQLAQPFAGLVPLASQPPARAFKQPQSRNMQPLSALAIHKHPNALECFKLDRKAIPALDVDDGFVDSTVTTLANAPLVDVQVNWDDVTPIATPRTAKPLSKLAGKTCVQVVGK